MKQSMIVAGLVASLVSVQAANADEKHDNPEGLYLGANIGAAFFNDDDINDFEDGGTLGVQLGYRWSDHFRTELELSGAAAEIDNSDEVVGYGRATLGAYYDLQPTSHFIVPYFGGGIGTTSVFLESDDGDDDDNGLLSLHGEAGLTLNINEHFALVPSYRYTWVEDDTDILEDDLTSHAVRIGARISF